jgi:hypothetical protein
VGHELTWLVPVVDNHAVTWASQLLDLGCEHLFRHFLDLLGCVSCVSRHVSRVLRARVVSCRVLSCAAPVVSCRDVLTRKFRRSLADASPEQLPALRSIFHEVAEASSDDDTVTPLARAHVALSR